MRPAEIKREIERLTVDASLARSTMGSLKQRLGEAMRIVAEVRAALGQVAPATKPATEAEGTPAPRRVQGDAGSV